MEKEGTSWIVKGRDLDDPRRIKTCKELAVYINKVGFLPFFSCDLSGFSVEENVSPLYWWTGDKANDPWEWREIIAETEDIAYGKFFNNKTGFISKEWFPYFANARRDGYDFDAAWDDGLVQRRYKAIMDICEDGQLHVGHELKKQAGFGKEGYKNFDGCIAGLQMQTYLLIKKFERKKNKKGESYGMAVSCYEKPEAVWGYDFVTSAYKEDPRESAERIVQRAKEMFPGASEDTYKKIAGYNFR